MKQKIPILIFIFGILSIGIMLSMKKNDRDEIVFEELIQAKVLHPGIGIGNLIIGKTKMSEVFRNQEERRKYIDAGFDFHFQKGETLIEIELANTGNFQSESGKKLGKSVKTFLDNYGQPKSKNISLKKGDVVIGEMTSLNYDGLTAIFHDSIVHTIIISGKTK